MPGYDPRALLEQRLRPHKPGLLDIDSPLEHFALITYAVPPERLAHHIPSDRFETPTFDIDGEERALLSVVPFIDAGFHFRLLPFVRFRFAQTNYRVYVTNRETGEPVVWFFGTTLGGWPVHLARLLWKVPWYPAKFTWTCEFDSAKGRYGTYRYETRSKWGAARIEVRDTGRSVDTLPGFASRDEMTLVLTHPADGYFHRLDGSTGTYSVSHDVLPLTVGEPIDLHFDLLERLGVLSAAEMQRPHSVLLCRETVFHICMSPRRVR